MSLRRSTRIPAAPAATAGFAFRLPTQLPVSGTAPKPRKTVPPEELVETAIDGFREILYHMRRAATYSPYQLSDAEIQERNERYGGPYDAAVDELERIEEEVEEKKLPITNVKNLAQAKAWVMTQMKADEAQTLGESRLNVNEGNFF